MTQIGKEYGAALFALACEANARHEYADALKQITDALQGTPEYLELLSSPNIPKSDRLATIDQAFSSLPTHVLSFLKLLCEKGRVPCLAEAAEEYGRLLAASEQTAEALIRSSVPLTEEQTARLKEKLERLCNKQITMKLVIDETLLGGIVIEVDGKVLDGSLRHRLNEVKEVISR